jgi:hypothetical protein
VRRCRCRLHGCRRPRLNVSCVALVNNLRVSRSCRPVGCSRSWLLLPTLAIACSDSDRHGNRETTDTRDAATHADSTDIPGPTDATMATLDGTNTTHEPDAGGSSDPSPGDAPTTTPNHEDSAIPTEAT